MIYSKEMNARSPLRVFEKSIHGGLGRGNLGVVMSRAGVGKTAFLIGVALDDLLRDRKVLHVSNKESVNHVREFYDEVFRDLCRAQHVEDVPSAHIRMERARMIHTYPNGDFSLEKLERSIEFLRQHAEFDPEVIILDGFDFETAAEDDLTLIKDLAGKLEAEIWLSALTHRDEPVTNPKGIPNPVARFDAWLSVMVLLQPEGNAVTVRLLKDHENEDLADLHMKLDPTTLLLHADE